MTENIVVGRIVHYVLESGRSEGAHRPAIIVRDLKQPHGLVQLQVFTDGLNDRYLLDDHVAGESPNVIWRTDVRYSEKPEPGTWHFMMEG